MKLVEWSSRIADNAAQGGKEALSLVVDMMLDKARDGLREEYPRVAKRETWARIRDRAAELFNSGAYQRSSMRDTFDAVVEDAVFLELGRDKSKTQATSKASGKRRTSKASNTRKRGGTRRTGDLSKDQQDQALFKAVIDRSHVAGDVEGARSRAGFGG